MLFGSSYDPKRDIPDLTGKVAIVTGGNAGIGFETVKQLLSHGAKVYLGARSKARGTAAAARLQELGSLGSESIEVFQIDLSSVVDSKRAAEEFLKKEKRLDILINNAGQFGMNERVLTGEGIVNSIATNHLGHFVLTTTLLPLLRETAAQPGSDVRIVNVTSSSYAYAPPIGQIATLKDLDVAPETGVQNGVKRYGLSKLCNVWFTRELQKRLTAEGSNVTVTCLHPGGVATSGLQGFFNEFPGPLGYILWPIVRFLLGTPETGAYTSLFAATSTKVRDAGDKYKGAYLNPPNVITTLEGQATDDALATQLWELSEKVVAEVLQNGSVDMRS